MVIVIIFSSSSSIIVMLILALFIMVFVVIIMVIVVLPIIVINARVSYRRKTWTFISWRIRLTRNCFRPFVTMLTMYSIDCSQNLRKHVTTPERIISFFRLTITP